MVRVAHGLARWMARYAAERWPAEARPELRQEWLGELRVLAGDGDLPAVRRSWRMLAFGGSLVARRPSGGHLGGPGLGAVAWPQLAVVAVAMAGYLGGILFLQRLPMGGNSYVISDLSWLDRLGIGAYAMVPVPVAAAGGWLLGRHLRRRESLPTVGPVSLGGCLIGFVSAVVGLSFLLEHAVPYDSSWRFIWDQIWPPTMAYHFGNQPAGMIVSWVVWFVAFVFLARLVLAVRALGRPLGTAIAGSAAVVGSAAVAVTVATFVQFDRGTAPLSQAWLWFAQWLVPPSMDISPDEGGYSFHSARGYWEAVTTYPHVLLACSAFGIAFLLTHAAFELRPMLDGGVRGRTTGAGNPAAKLP